MGFFSWKTSDTGESIPNRHSGRKTFAVKMLDDKGNEYIERSYEGYGEFGGVDYYELLALMNNQKLPQYPDLRDRGIRIEFNKRCKNVRRPKLVTLHCTKRWDELPDSPMCPDQGYFYNF